MVSRLTISITALLTNVNVHGVAGVMELRGGGLRASSSPNNAVKMLDPDVGDPLNKATTPVETLMAQPSSRYSHSLYSSGQGGLRGQAAASFLEEEETDAEGDAPEGDVFGVAEAVGRAAIGAQDQRENLLQKARLEKSLFVQVEQAQQGHRQAEKSVIDALSCGGDACGDTDVEDDLVQQLSGGTHTHAQGRTGPRPAPVSEPEEQPVSETEPYPTPESTPTPIVSDVIPAPAPGVQTEDRVPTASTPPPPTTPLPTTSTPAPSTERGSSTAGPGALPLAPESTGGPAALPLAPPPLPPEVVNACNGPSESARKLFGRSVEHGGKKFQPTLQKHNSAGDGTVCIGGGGNDFVEAEFEIPGDAVEVHQLTLVHVDGGISCSMGAGSGCNLDMWGSRHNTLSPWVIKDRMLDAAMPGVAGEETSKGDPVLPVQGSYEDIKRDFKNKSYRYLPVKSREELPGNNGGSAGIYEIWAVGGANHTALTFRNTVAPGNGFPALAPGKYKIVVGENYFNGMDIDNIGVTCMRVFACGPHGNANPAAASSPAVAPAGTNAGSSTPVPQLPPAGQVPPPSSELAPGLPGATTENKNSCARKSEFPMQLWGYTSDHLPTKPETMCIGGNRDDPLEAVFEVPPAAVNVHQLTLEHVSGAITCSHWESDQHKPGGCRLDMWGSRGGALSPWVVKGYIDAAKSKNDEVVLPVRGSFADIRGDWKAMDVDSRMQSYKGNMQSYRYLPRSQVEQLPERAGGYLVWAAGGANDTTLIFRDNDHVLAPGKYKVTVGENYFAKAGPNPESTDNKGRTCFRLYACVEKAGSVTQGKLQRTMSVQGDELMSKSKGVFAFQTDKKKDSPARLPVDFVDNYEGKNKQEPTFGDVFYVDNEHVFHPVSGNRHQGMLMLDSRWQRKEYADRYGYESFRVQTIDPLPTRSTVLLFDFDHMPAGNGLAPAFWSTDEKYWPHHGELLMGGSSNLATAMHSSLRTGDRYVSTPCYALVSDKTARCGAGVENPWYTPACGDTFDGTRGTGVKTYWGTAVNKKRGSLFAMSWQKDWIKMWQWAHDDTSFPEGLRPKRKADGEVTDALVDEESAVGKLADGSMPGHYVEFRFDEGRCDPEEVKEQRFIINLSICGSVAGGSFGGGAKAGGGIEACKKYVAGAMEDWKKLNNGKPPHFLVNFFKVYNTAPGGAEPTTPASTTAEHGATELAAEPTGTTTSTTTKNPSELDFPFGPENGEPASTEGPGSTNEVQTLEPTPTAPPEKPLVDERDIIHRFASLGKAVADFQLLLLGKTLSPEDFDANWTAIPIEYGVGKELRSNVPRPHRKYSKLQRAYVGGARKAIDRIGKMTSEEWETAERRAAEDMLDGEEVGNIARLRRMLKSVADWFAKETETLRARVPDHYRYNKTEDYGFEIGEDIVEQAITMPNPWIYWRYLFPYWRRDLKSGKCASQLNEVLVLSRTMSVVQGLLSPASDSYERSMTMGRTGSEYFLWLLDRPWETITKNCGEACRSECNDIYWHGLEDGDQMVRKLDGDERAIQVGKLEKMLEKDGSVPVPGGSRNIAEQVARPTQRSFDKFLEKTAKELQGEFSWFQCGGVDHLEEQAHGRLEERRVRRSFTYQLRPHDPGNPSDKTVSRTGVTYDLEFTERKEKSDVDEDECKRICASTPNCVAYFTREVEYYRRLIHPTENTHVYQEGEHLHTCKTYTGNHYEYQRGDNAAKGAMSSWKEIFTWKDDKGEQHKVLPRTSYEEGHCHVPYPTAEHVATDEPTRTTTSTTTTDPLDFLFGPDFGGT